MIGSQLRDNGTSNISEGRDARSKASQRPCKAAWRCYAMSGCNGMAVYGSFGQRDATNYSPDVITGSPDAKP
jgi:hypothetical protein